MWTLCYANLNENQNGLKKRYTYVALSNIQRFRVFRSAKSVTMSLKSKVSATSNSILLTDREFNRCCVIQLWSSFLINFNLEKDRSPVQFVTIIDRKIAPPCSLSPSLTERFVKNNLNILKCWLEIVLLYHCVDSWHRRLWHFWKWQRYIGQRYIGQIYIGQTIGCLINASLRNELCLNMLPRHANDA